MESSLIEKKLNISKKTYEFTEKKRTKNVKIVRKSFESFASTKTPTVWTTDLTTYDRQRKK